MFVNKTRPKLREQVLVLLVLVPCWYGCGSWKRRRGIAVSTMVQSRRILNVRKRRRGIAVFGLVQSVANPGRMETATRDDRF
jgi:hypothetical protein